jgi:glycosyltransferase involved in cell wall biosynthesis
MVDLKMFDYHQNGSDFRRLMRIPDDAFVFMMIGRIQEWKGQDVFVRAALEVSKTYPNSYFIVVGSPWQKVDFRFEAMLRRWVLEAGAEKRVIFSPFVAEPAEVYAAADVVCHCSREPEPFGLVIVEAMAMKKPVIAMKAGGPLETVREGVDGWLVRPGDATALAEVMRDCLHAGDQLIRAGEEGYRSVVTRFGETAFSKGINELIDRYTRRSECRGR